MIHKPNARQVSERALVGRRGFLGVLTAGSFVTVAPVPIAAGGISQIARLRGRALYRESVDVKTFYRVNRYP
jgi:hypothetical protein